MAVAILGVLAGITSVAFAGFDSSTSSVSCRADRTRLQRAESTFYLQKARYGTETELVTAGLLRDSMILGCVIASAGGYPGGLKSVSLREQLRIHPDRVLRDAVWGMLPHNRMGNSVLKRLKIYAGPNHPHGLQNPEPLK